MLKRLLPTALLLTLALPAAAHGQAGLDCTRKVSDPDMQVLECTFARDDFATAYRALLQTLHPQTAQLPQELPSGSRVYPADDAHRYVKWASADEVLVAEENNSGSFAKATLRRENGAIAVHWVKAD
ncbi:hypothetical protein L1281_001430 [Neisseria sp. HSC-16F19]|nr:hypothetical protein [Neisseria sp. HSC-16F19]MCP2040840.1 hypothetical protein [Neisseria sp. HSC-16F19]